MPAYSVYLLAATELATNTSVMEYRY